MSESQEIITKHKINRDFSCARNKMSVRFCHFTILCNKFPNRIKMLQFALLKRNKESNDGFQAVRMKYSQSIYSNFFFVGHSFTWSRENNEIQFFCTKFFHKEPTWRKRLMLVDHMDGIARERERKIEREQGGSCNRRQIEWTHGRRPDIRASFKFESFLSFTSLVVRWILIYVPMRQLSR